MRRLLTSHHYAVATKLKKKLFSKVEKNIFCLPLSRSLKALVNHKRCNKRYRQRLVVLSWHKKNYDLYDTLKRKKIKDNII